MVEAPEPPHHHHHSLGIPWFDFIVPVAVLCISVASLLTSLQSEKSMHALVEQNARLVSAQSTPLLMLDTGNLEDGKPVLSMTLRNVGTGPARIAWFHVTDAEGVSYSGGAFYERLAKLDPRVRFISEQIAATMMRSGDQRFVFNWPRPADNEAALADWKTLDTTRFHLNSSACYCSMFDECWTTEFGDARPKPVPSCDPAAAGK